MAMAGPLYVLYEGCILVARLRERAQRRRRAVEPGAQELERLPDDATSYVDDRPSGPVAAARPSRPAGTT
jgi:hypothetical protein